MRANLSLNTITIKQEKDLVKKINTTSEAGFKGIGLWDNEIKIFLRDKEIDELSSNLKRLNLRVVEVCAVNGPKYGYEHLPEITKFEEAEDCFSRCKCLGCNVVISPPFSGVADIKDRVKDLIQLCDVAKSYGVNIAYEFIGFVKQVNNIGIAWEIVRRTNRENCGIVLDTFHFFRGRSKIETLKQIPLEKILLVHISNALNKPIDELVDADRVFPNEGVIPLKSILSDLEKREYNGYYSVEIFNEKYWDSNPLSIAKQAQYSTNEVLSSI